MIIYVHIAVHQSNTYTGWWLTYPSEKYESQLGLLFIIYGKRKNVPNHQPGMVMTCVKLPATENLMHSQVRRCCFLRKSQHSNRM